MIRPNDFGPPRVSVLRAAAAVTFAVILAVLSPHSIADEKPYPAYTAADLAGSWTYRSFHNNPSPVGGDPERALALFFAEATFEFALPEEGRFDGVLDWGSGGLDLAGNVAQDADGVAVRIVGSGRPGSQTDGWRHDYNARLAHRWPNGVEQVPSLVGTVIRVNPHGPAEAGYVASFVAVKRP